MTTPPKPKKVKAPEGCLEYLTAGKEYDVLKIMTYGRYGYMLEIMSDNGIMIFTNEFKSLHLNGKNWIVTEYEEQQ